MVEPQAGRGDDMIDARRRRTVIGPHTVETTSDPARLAELLMASIDLGIHLSRDKAEDLREHLGASLIGSECDRAIYYTFRWFTKARFPARILRIFERGHLQEAPALEWLRATGAEVLERDPDTGEQYRVTDPQVSRLFGGSIDAIARGLPGMRADRWCGIEIKTCNRKTFAKLRDHCVDQDSFSRHKGRHFGQMQTYMDLSVKEYQPGGCPPLDVFLYLAICKDDDEIYVRYIDYDPPAASALRLKAHAVIDAPEPPTSRQYNIGDPAYYQCKLCDHSAVCHYGSAPLKNCRTCDHVVLTFPLAPAGGRWLCTLHNTNQETTAQRAGCGDWQQQPEIGGTDDPCH